MVSPSGITPRKMTGGLATQAPSQPPQSNPTTTPATFDSTQYTRVDASILERLHASGTELNICFRGGIVGHYNKLDGSITIDRRPNAAVSLGCKVAKQTDPTKIITHSILWELQNTIFTKSLLEQVGITSGTESLTIEDFFQILHQLELNCHRRIGSVPESPVWGVPVGVSSV